MGVAYGWKEDVDTRILGARRQLFLRRHEYPGVFKFTSAGGRGDYFSGLANGTL
jgi:hypothetical protein